MWFWTWFWCGRCVTWLHWVKLVSKVSLRPWITFLISRSLAFDMELCRRSLQLLALASLMVPFSSWQASVHSCWFWWIVWWSWFLLGIFGRTCGLIQSFNFLLGLVLPMWNEATDVRMLLKHAIQIDIFGSSRICCKRDSTSLVKEDQSEPLQRHLIFLLGITGWYLFLQLMTMSFGRWCELPIGSAGVHDVLFVLLHPKSDKLGVLLLLLIPLVWMIQPVILSPQPSGNWT